MQILTQRSINIEALRKTMRMIWKPNKGVLISDVEEDLFLVEFGDKRDKQKVLDMSPWSYEKNLVLLQDFDGDAVPKDINLIWSPFWVQIFNLPLKSRTRETGWRIGCNLGEVMDVDVPENGVQWGRCLRVRIKINVTKKLVRGKKIKFGDNDHRWVFFKYERLPNFCYICGKLGHGEKECKEGVSPRGSGSEGAYQYGAWLRGEPGKRAFNNLEHHHSSASDHSSPELRHTHGSQGRKEHSHVRDGVHNTHVTRMVGEEAETDMTVTPPKPLTDQVEPRQAEKQALSSEPDVPESYVISSNLKKDIFNLGKTLSSDLGDTEGLVKEEAQWRTGISAKKKDIVIKDNEMLSKEMEKSQHNPWTKDDGPTTMIYDTNLGWTDEPIGPTVRYWKRITRPSENKSLENNPIIIEDKKRVGPTPIQELDPTSITKKRKKGKQVVTQNEEKHSNTDGGLAEAAMQPRPAQ